MKTKNKHCGYYMYLSNFKARALFGRKTACINGQFKK